MTMTPRQATRPWSADARTCPPPAAGGEGGRGAARGSRRQRGLRSGSERISQQRALSLPPQTLVGHDSNSGQEMRCCPGSRVAGKPAHAPL